MAYAENVVSGASLQNASGYVGPSPAEFGVRGVNSTSVAWDDAMIGRHVLYLGGIGTGKTVGITALVQSVRDGLTSDDVMVFFDTKGDYYKTFYRPDDAVIAATVAPDFEGQVVWNMFKEFGNVSAGRSVEDEIFEMCNGLFSTLVSDAGDNSYFANAARDVFVALVTAMYRRSTDLSNEDVRIQISGMTGAEMRELLELPGNEDLRGAKNYIAKDGTNSSAATLAFMQQVIQESFRSAFGRPGDFSIRQFLREKGGKALFLEYDIASGGLLSPIYKTMLDVAMKDAMSRTRAGGRIFFILDEFALLPELTHLSNGLNFGRSLGLRFIVGAQNIRQVQEMYGEHLAASVLSSFGTVFAFRLFDGKSREFVRDRFGRNRKIVRFDSSVREKGTNETTSDGYVVEDWDLSGLPVGSCIAALPEHDPVRFAFEFEKS